MRSRFLIWAWLPCCLAAFDARGQITERQRPAQWQGLVYGGRFMDRFLPMPVQGPLTSDTWGAENVKPRYVENGIEDNEWSYWGGNALLGPDGKYHLYVCRWPEDSSRGHMEWGNSIVVHAVADRSTGPYQVKDTVGRGHNPEVFQLEDGRHVIYVMGGYYIADDVDGPWEKGRFEFDPRDRRIIEGLSNLSFARREDGIRWKVEPGEAYMPGIARYADGTVVDWFKYERIKVLQDEHGRATQADFAVIDVPKREDRGDDVHSSKHICIPLTVGRLLTLVDPQCLTADTKTIRVRIAAEEGFDPPTDVDVGSLRFGASEVVNFGRGCKAIKAERQGNDLMVTFDATGHGLTENNFAAKLLGKDTHGKLLFGYARLPWVDYLEPALSPRAPRIEKKGGGFRIAVEVQNFGQVASEPVDMEIICGAEDRGAKLAAGKVPALDPFEKTTIELTCGDVFEAATAYTFTVVIDPDAPSAVTLERQITPVP